MESGGAPSPPPSRMLPSIYLGLVTLLFLIVCVFNHISPVKRIDLLCIGKYDHVEPTTNGWRMQSAKYYDCSQGGYYIQLRV